MSLISSDRISLAIPKMQKLRAVVLAYDCPRNKFLVLNLVSISETQLEFSRICLEMMSNLNSSGAFKIFLPWMLKKFHLWMMRLSLRATKSLRDSSTY